MQMASVQQTIEKCPTGETETPFWALNEVSRAQGKPITNCTFHTLGCGGCEGGEKENPWACHLKLIELSHAMKTLVINPLQLNKAFRFGKNLKFIAVISSWVFQEELAAFLHSIEKSQRSNIGSNKADF